MFSTFVKSPNFPLDALNEIHKTEICSKTHGAGHWVALNRVRLFDKVRHTSAFADRGTKVLAPRK